MGTPADYRIGTAALAVVIASAIKANVPSIFMGEVTAHQDMIDQITSSGAKAVIDAVDKSRTNKAST